MKEEISVDSTKEEIANYFLNNFKISQKAKEKLLKEDISGNVLLDLTEKDFDYLSIKLGRKAIVLDFLKNNSEKFKPKEIKERLTIKSNNEKVKYFFEKCLGFKGNLDNMDGKRLIELEGKEEEMKKLGLNLGQRKKLIRYINHFKTLKEEPEDVFIFIDEESSEEDIVKFLRLKSKLSQESIEAAELIDAQSLFSLTEDLIDITNDIKEEEKEGLKKSLIEIRLTIDPKSTKEDVDKFLKMRFGVSDYFLKNMNLDGQKLALLTPEEIDEFEEMNQKKKEKLKDIVNKLKQKQSQIDTKETDIKQNKGQIDNIKNDLQKNQKQNNEENIEENQELDKKQNDIINPKEEKEEKNYFNRELTKKKEEKEENEEKEEEQEDIKMDKPKNEIIIKNEKTEPLPKKEQLKFDLKENKPEINNDISESQIENEINLNFNDSEFNPKQKVENLELEPVSIPKTEISEIKQNIQLEKEPKLEAEQDQEQIQNPEPEIRISYDSTKEDIANFLKSKLGFNDDLISKLEFDGETIFLLNEEDIKDLEDLSEKEKADLINILKEINIQITSNSNSEEVAKFLESTLCFNNEAIKELDLTGGKIFSLKEEDINQIKGISKGEKDRLKKYLNIMNITIKKNK